MKLRTYYHRCRALQNAFMHATFCSTGLDSLRYMLECECGHRFTKDRKPIYRWERIMARKMFRCYDIVVSPTSIRYIDNLGKERVQVDDIIRASLHQPIVFRIADDVPNEDYPRELKIDMQKFVQDLTYANTISKSGPFASEVVGLLYRAVGVE